MLTLGPHNFCNFENVFNLLRKKCYIFNYIDRKLETNAPYDELPKLDRKREELSDSEKPIYDFFMNDDCVAKMFEFLALEEEKNTDKFRQSVLKFFMVTRLSFLNTLGLARLGLLPLMLCTIELNVSYFTNLFIVCGRNL